MRSIVLVMLLVACGSKDPEEKKHGPDHPAYPPDAAAPWKPVPGALAGIIPSVEGPLPAVSGAPPLAAVIIDADGTVRVAATRGSWQTVTAPGFRDGATVVAAPERELAGALLTILQDAGGATAALAQALLEERADGMDAEDDEARPGAAGDGTVDVLFTYAAADGALTTPATPLLLVHPAAFATRLAEIVDMVGGTIAVADGDTLALLPTVFPWANGNWGGADLGDEERVSIDLHVGQGRFDFVDAKGNAEGVELLVEPLTSAIRARIGTKPLHPEPVTDVMITAEADVQNLITALATLEAAGAPRIGIAVSPWPFVRSLRQP